MNFKSKLTLFFLFLSVLLISALAVAFPNKQEEARLELKQCMKHCLSQQDGGEQHECIQECHQGYKERQQEEKARFGDGYNMELMEAMINPSSDDEDSKDLEKCKLECVIEAKRGVIKELECAKKCDEKCQEKQEMRMYRKSHSIDKDDDKEEFKQCLIDCAMGATHTVDEVYECDLKCVEKHKGKRDMPRGDLIINLEEGKKKEKLRLGGYYMELFDTMEKTRDEDHKKELEKCQLDCVLEAKGGVSKEMECVKKRYEDYKKMQERHKKRRQSQSFDMEDTNEHDDDNESKRLKCQRYCVSSAKHTYEEIYECEKKCFEDYPPHQRERRGQSIYNEHSKDKKELEKCD